MTKKQTQEADEPRPPGPKFRNVLPDNFRIRPSPSPMGQILNEAERGSESPQSSQLHESSQPPEQPATGHESSQLHQSSQPRESSQLQQGNQKPSGTAINLMAALPEVKGHQEIPHQILDHLNRQLNVHERAVFGELYRLSWGFHKKTCFISNPALADRASQSVSQAKKTVARLIQKGLIKKTGNVQGFGKSQGVEYEVAAPTWQLQRSSQLQQGRQPQGSRQPPQSTYKEDQKEIDQRDVSQCPDCFGSGHWYPNGTSGGVRPNCKHPRLTEGKS